MISAAEPFALSLYSVDMKGSAYDYPLTSVLHPGRFNQPMNMPAVCYLVQTDDSSNILIDSGMPDPAILPPEFTVGMGDNVIQQLSSIGLGPDDIDLLICTHFDIDHAGHHAAFNNAQFVVQRSHYDYAQDNPRFAITHPQWNQPIERFRFVDGDTELMPGLTLLRTDGHTLGHQSALVKLSETGSVLLAIDAVPNQRCFTPDRQPWPQDEDQEAARASTRKLITVSEREAASLVIFGHDGDQWQGLRKLPEYYD
jgi:N-acyl homoserine lactone hydrolase